MFQKFSRTAVVAQELQRKEPVAPTIISSEPEPAATSASSKHIALKVYLHEKLLSMLNLSVLDKVTRDELRGQLAPLIRDVLTEDGIAINTAEYQKLLEEVLDEVLGLGPLEPFLKDPTVSDILINTHKQVFVERMGK